MHLQLQEQKHTEVVALLKEQQQVRTRRIVHTSQFERAVVTRVFSSALTRAHTTQTTHDSLQAEISALQEQVG